MAELERLWQSQTPVDLRLVLGPLDRGPGLCTFGFEGVGRGGRGSVRAAWWATRTPDGPGTLRLVVEPATATVRATAWGPGAQWLCDTTPRLLGSDDDPRGFRPHHPQVAEAWRQARGVRIMSTRRSWEACLLAVLEQKVTGGEARRAWQTLVGRLGEPAPGPAPQGMVVPPPASAWRGLSDADYHRAGVTPHRARTLRSVAVAASAVARTDDASSARADQVLRALPGIGVWTSAEVRQRSHGDPDAVSFGDFHLAKDLCWWLTGERGDDDRMAELLEPYAGHRYRVQRLLEIAGAGAPRRGPRMTVPQHRSW